MKQPKALKVFFLTEMWERFGFYVNQAMLVLYLTQALSFSDERSYAILGQFTALAYIMPIIGGWACDRFLGNRMAVLSGGLLLCIGYALLSLNQDMLFLGLSLAAAGNGLLKPNISSFLGQYYHVNDPRREAGFTIFYVGINTGVLLATLSAGYIRDFLGWSACFGAASLALLIGVSVFRYGFRYFENKGLPPQNLQKVKILLGFAAAIAVVYVLMVSEGLGSYALYGGGLFFLFYLIWLAIKSDEVFRTRIFAILLLFMISTVFWGLFFEIFLAVNLFTERAVDRILWGHQIPASVFIGLEDIFIILIGPALALMWQKLSESARQGNSLMERWFSIPMKFALSLLLLGVSMQVLVFAIGQSSSTAGVSAGWLVLFYLFVTLGELFISPIGLSMITEFMPAEYSGLMMGAWFMTLGFGGKLSGVLAQYASVPEGSQSVIELNAIYQQAFQSYAWIGFAAFFVGLLFIPLVNRWLKVNIHH